MLRRTRTRVLVLLLMVMIAAASWRGWVAHRQSTLDRALIAAVSSGDAAAVVTLLSEGASANAQDLRESEAHGWLERAQHLLTGRFYAADPAPVLAIAMGTSNEAIIHTLKQHGADEDAAMYWKAASEWPNEDVAITNGIHLLHRIVHPTKSDVSTQMRNWRRKRVAFCLQELPDRAFNPGIGVEVEWNPVKSASSDPLGPYLYSVTDVSLVGTVRSVDVTHKVIHILLKSTDVHMLMRIRSLRW